MRSSDYDPVSRTGTFVGAALPQATSWATYTLPLSAYAGRKVYAAFHYQSLNGGLQSDGPFVDDLHVKANSVVMLPMVRKWMLTIAKSVSASTAMPGQTLVYSITVNNTDSSNAATGVDFYNDTVPVSATFAERGWPVQLFERRCDVVGFDRARAGQLCPTPDGHNSQHCAVGKQDCQSKLFGLGAARRVSDRQNDGYIRQGSPV